MIYREDHERDVMLQPKRSTWDSYVPSKSKTKVGGVEKDEDEDEDDEGGGEWW